MGVEKVKNGIIVDIDGTLTSGFGGVPNKPIIALVKRYEVDHDILIITYRKSSEASYTEKFLRDHNINYTKLWYTEDKIKLYEEHIKDKWDITFVLEDNKKIIDKFRGVGVKTLEVNEQLYFPPNILNPDYYNNRDAIIHKKPQKLDYYHEPILLMLKGESILDAGAGNGIFIPAMLKRGMEVTAIDYSKPSIENIKNKYPEVKAYVHNLKDPIPEYYFDQVLCHLALHYLEDWAPPLKEFGRLAESIILCINHPRYTGSLAEEYKKSQVVNLPFGQSNKQVNYMPVFHKSLETIHSIFNKAGLTIVDLKEPRKEYILYELRSKRN